MISMPLSSKRSVSKRKLKSLNRLVWTSERFVVDLVAFVNDCLSNQ